MLLLVSGKQEMLIYTLKDAEIEERKHFRIENPTYSDNEGHFKVRTGGKVMRSGSVRETDDREIIVKFKNEIASNLDEIKQTFDEVYISAPGKTKNEILEALPIDIKEKVTKTIVGNYCSLSPIEILDLFSEEEEDEIQEAEVRKILKKNNQVT